MLSFDQIVPRAAEAAGDKPVLAAPYPLAESLCRNFASGGIIGGFIANQKPESAAIDPVIAGWWTNRTQGTWFVRGSAGKTMIMLGATPESDIGPRMLLEARLKGVQRILLIAEDGSIASHIDTS